MSLQEALYPDHCRSRELISNGMLPPIFNDFEFVHLIAGALRDCMAAVAGEKLVRRVERRQGVVIDRRRVVLSLSPARTRDAVLVIARSVRSKTWIYTPRCCAARARTVDHRSPQVGPTQTGAAAGCPVRKWVVALSPDRMALSADDNNSAIYQLPKILWCAASRSIQVLAN